MHVITEQLKSHYEATFLKYGATSAGMDWGPDEERARVRQAKMLEVLNTPDGKFEDSFSILDVGCGYGALVDCIEKNKLTCDYLGIDVVPSAIECAREIHREGTFFLGDFLDAEIPHVDFAVCNGILTQKLDASFKAMNVFSQNIIKKMFSVCDKGIAFNLMNTHVNHLSDNLYYRNPSEILSWCMSELSPRVRLDCAYMLPFEYTVFVYKEYSDAV